MNFDTLLENIFSISEEQKKTLKKIGIFSIYDLLHYFPIKYENFNKISNIKNLKNENEINFYTKTLSIKNKKKSEISFFPIYRESGIRKGKISSKWIYHKIKKVLSNEKFVKEIIDSIPEKVLRKYNLPNLKNSFFYLHLPQKIKDAEVARKRFSFEEIFLIQLVKGIEREKYQNSESFIIKPEKEKKKNF